MKYLDEAGLSYLLSKLRDIYALKGEAGGSGKTLNAAIITLDRDSFENDGQPHAPKVQSVMLAGQPLTENVDYALVPIHEASAGGTYSVIAVGIGAYTGAAIARWSVAKAKAAGKVTLSSLKLTVKGVMGTTDSTITVSRLGTGAIHVSSLDSGTATASLSGSKIVVRSVKPGSATIRVSVDGDENYTAAEADLFVTVERADGSISVSPSNVTIEGDLGTTADVTLKYTGNGSVTVSSSGYVSTARSGTRLTLTGKAYGSGSLTIQLAQTNDYTAASCTLGFTVKEKTAGQISDTFGENSWAAIEQACYNGEAEKHWKIGDKKTAKRNGVTYQWTIGGFNHYDLATSDKYYDDPKYNNGTKKANMVLIQEEIFTDSHAMSTSDVSDSNWEDCKFRTTELPEIKSELDQDFVSVVRKVVIRSGKSGTDYYTRIDTEDDFFLMSEKEVFGNANNSIGGEGDYLQYFQDGNSRIKNQNGVAAMWLLRSPLYKYKNRFCCVSKTGTSTQTAGYSNAGVVLAVCI